MSTSGMHRRPFEGRHLVFCNTSLLSKEAFIGHLLYSEWMRFMKDCIESFLLSTVSWSGIQFLEATTKGQAFRQTKVSPIKWFVVVDV